MSALALVTVPRAKTVKRSQGHMHGTHFSNARAHKNTQGDYAQPHASTLVLSHTHTHTHTHTVNDVLQRAQGRRSIAIRKHCEVVFLSLSL